MLLAPIINPAPDVGVFPAVKSYVIVVIGGMGSIPGSIAAALALGVLESFGAVYLSYDYRDTFGLVLLELLLHFARQAADRAVVQIGGQNRVLLICKALNIILLARVN